MAHNSCLYGGGLFFWYNSAPIVRNNKVAYNEADLYGGGVYCYESAATIEYNIFFENHADAYGGAFYCRYTPVPTIRHNIITYNTSNKGAALYLSHCPVSISNCHMFRNIADKGGAIFNILSDSSLTNCTLFHNKALTEGGGFYQNRSPVVPITNCILWNNKPEQIFNVAGPDPIVSYSNIENGYAGEANMDTDPFFVVGPLGNRYLAQVSAYQPMDSPCVNAGDPASAMVEGTTRTDSVQDSDTVDMGYYHPVYCLSNQQVSPSIGTSNDLYTYSVDVLTEDEVPPYKVYLSIDGEYSGEMTLTSGTPGNGTYSFSTYLEGAGYHEAVFQMDTIPQKKIPGTSKGHYSLPTESMKPFHLPLVTDLLEAKDYAQPAVDPTGEETKSFPSTAGG